VAIGTGSSIGEDTERLVEQVARSGATALTDTALAERLGALIADGMVGSLLDLRSTLRRIGGEAAGAESSIRKLVGVAHRQHLADLALDLAGTDGTSACDEANGVLLARALSIAGGTTQVLLSVVGERLLGLPRD
jgi:alkylation response protein AidB-like acyl-CoA dehydrogenase